MNSTARNTKSPSRINFLSSNHSSNRTGGSGTDTASSAMAKLSNQPNPRKANPINLPLMKLIPKLKGSKHMDS